jgi:hypothetical protein
LSKSLAKQWYLEQLRTKPAHHRAIANRMSSRFNLSAGMIKDELLAEGYIKLDKVVRMGETQKNNHFYVLTGKQYKDHEPVVVKHIDEFWPCGTKKSTGNAFDLSRSKGLFSIRELSNMTNKGRPNNFPVIAYSRA